MNTNTHIDLSNVFSVFVIGCIILGIFVAVIIIATNRAKAFKEIFTVVLKTIGESVNLYNKNKAMHLKNENIRLNGHMITCAYCGCTHRFPDMTSIPDKCPNCGGAFIDTQKDEADFVKGVTAENKYQQSIMERQEAWENTPPKEKQAVKMIILIALIPIILLVLMMIFM